MLYITVSEKHSMNIFISQCFHHCVERVLPFCFVKCCVPVSHVFSKMRQSMEVKSISGPLDVTHTFLKSYYHAIYYLTFKIEMFLICKKKYFFQHMVHVLLRSVNIMDTINYWQTWILTKTFNPLVKFPHFMDQLLMNSINFT